MTAPKHLVPRPPPRHRRAGLILLGGGALTVLAAVALPDQDLSRAVVAALAAATLGLVAVLDRTLGVFATTGYLAVLGLGRRLVSVVLPDPADDPLLLVAPLVVAGLALLVWRDGALRPPRGLTMTVAAAFVLTVAAIANPIAGPTANAKGALFWSVPMLWFVVGRALPERADMARLLRLVAVLGVGASATGILQATVGFPPWDDRWIENRGYEALGINSPDTIRPFGWSSSAGEFALTAAFVVLLCAILSWTALRAGRWLGAAGWGAGLAVGAAALGLSGVRTAVLLAGLALVVVAVASAGSRLREVLLGLAIVVVLLVGGVRALDVESWDGDGVSGMARRSLIGLTDPFGEESTLQGHVDLTEVAFRTLDDRPLGGGPAYGTTASVRRGGVLRSAENDLGNAALAFGIPGVVMVVGVTAIGLGVAWRHARAHPTFVALGCLALLVASLRFWWNGGQYATAALTWLCLGWTDRPER